MAKKVHAHKRHHHVDSETPRNSLDLQEQTSQKYGPQGELPHYYQVEEDWSENNRSSNEGSMKKLINEELSTRSSTRQNAPSIVARLMGIDMMPVDTKYVAPSDKRINENIGKKFSNKGTNERSSVSLECSNFDSSSHVEFDSFHKVVEDDNDDGWGRSFGKPMRREHPQEKELQKFKKEFEAYQAARFQECSKFAEIGSVSNRLIFQENLNKEKVAVAAHNTSMQRKVFPSKSRTLSRDFEDSLMLKSYNRLDTSSPTRIVILKPGPDSIFNHEENWTNSSGTLQGRHSIEDFLEEVKERLKCELQGKTVGKGFAVRGSEIEILRNKKPSDPKLIARQIVKQVKENVTRDSDSNSVGSESTRSYNGEVQFNGPSFNGYISRDSRSYLPEKLTNVVKSERHDDSEGNSRSNAFENHRVRLKKTEDVLKSAHDWEISKEETEIQTGSFRHEQENNIFFHRELWSPRNLVRSFSAPVSRSGTSFGKLLLEDRHILTGAHIRRKLEAVETMSVDVKKQKKERFNNIKEKVSNFRYSFALRGRIFGKRNQSMVESHGNEYRPTMRDITSGPTVLMNCGGERHENYTEVPPSPASVCSSVHEDFWKRAEYISPISTPDLSSRDDTVMPQVFRDISSGLNELRRQLNQLDSDDVEDFAMKQEPSESEFVQLIDPAESYIRDLLVASGLYFGSWDKPLLRGDTYAKPIGNSVFEEVEESHKKLIKENDENFIKNHKLDHRILLDLLNESLSIVLGPPLTLSRFRKKSCNSSMLAPPQGKELLKLVWDNIRVSLYPSSDISHYSLDTLVSQHLSSIPWSGKINDEINILEREIECRITNDLIEELTKDLL
ncbi:hypothetical protein P8452_41642 [Trifolium repens]|nr:hypothetical protein P8452_41642 [Trifolium repens]